MRTATARTIVSDTEANEAIEILILRAARRFGVASWSRALRTLHRAVCAGRDVIGIVPPRTSARARSLCWQLPTLGLSKPTVIVVPVLDDTPAPLAASGHARRAPLLYVTPERLVTDDCRALLRRNGVSRLVVDEGDGALDRASIADVSRALGAPPLLAVSTSADEEATHALARELSMRAPLVILFTGRGERP